MNGSAFHWESKDYESTADSSANVLGGNLPLVAIRSERKADPVFLTRDEMDDLCAEWMAHSLTADQFDTVMRVLIAVAKTPRGRAYGVQVS